MALKDVRVSLCTQTEQDGVSLLQTPVCDFKHVRLTDVDTAFSTSTATTAEVSSAVWLLSFLLACFPHHYGLLSAPLYQNPVNKRLYRGPVSFSIVFCTIIVL